MFWGIVDNQEIMDVISGLCSTLLLGVIAGTDGKKWQREYTSKFIKLEFMSINSGEQWEKPRVEGCFLFIYLNLPSDFLSLTLSLCCSLESGPSSDFPRSKLARETEGLIMHLNFTVLECAAANSQSQMVNQGQGERRLASLKEFIQIVPQLPLSSLKSPTKSPEPWP